MILSDCCVYDVFGEYRPFVFKQRLTAADYDKLQVLTNGRSNFDRKTKGLLLKKMGRLHILVGKLGMLKTALFQSGNRIWCSSTVIAKITGPNPFSLRTPNCRKE
jgi:hypothetical protein